jgi:hypothetical protein
MEGMREDGVMIYCDSTGSSMENHKKPQSGGYYMLVSARKLWWVKQK